MIRVAPSFINYQIYLSYYHILIVIKPIFEITDQEVIPFLLLHYWRNPEACLREIARVLKPQGRLVITDWCDDYIACKICDLFLRMFNRAHLKTYGKDACERLLRDTGYGNVRVERYKINWLWGMMTAKAQAHPA